MALTLAKTNAMGVRVQTARPAAARPVVAARKAVVVRASAPAPAPASRAAALSAGVTAAALAALSSPLAAQAAAVTPSLRNLIYSLVAGGVVLAGIAIAVTAVSSFDPVKRG